MRKLLFCSITMLALFIMLPISCSDSVTSEEKLTARALVESSTFKSFAESGKKWSNPYKDKIDLMNSSEFEGSQAKIHNIIQKVKSAKNTEIQSASQEELATLLGYKNFADLRKKHTSMIKKFQELMVEFPELKNMDGQEKEQIVAAALTIEFKPDYVKHSKSDVVSAEECANIYYACEDKAQADYWKYGVACSIGAAGLAYFTVGLSLLAGGSCVAAAANGWRADLRLCAANYEACAQ